MGPSKDEASFFFKLFFKFALFIRYRFIEHIFFLLIKCTPYVPISFDFKKKELLRPDPLLWPLASVDMLFLSLTPNCDATSVALQCLAQIYKLFGLKILGNLLKKNVYFLNL